MPVTYDFRKLSPEDREVMAKLPPRIPPDVKPGESPMPAFPPVTLPAGVFKEEVTINGIKGLRVYRKGGPQDRVVMHIHGGGYVWGSPEDGAAFMVAVQNKLGIDSYSVNYSLAPRHRYPVQLNECLAFYRGLAGMGYQKIVLAGESAGGNMCLALTLKLKDDKIRLPAAVISMSGVVDFTLSGGVELDDMFVVQPSSELWFGHDWQEKGQSLPDGFRYTSETNPQWLTVDQIREFIAPFEEIDAGKEYRLQDN